ncbi:Uncharacterized protein DBV15_12398, partial [Temnothorax longispinosus]
IVVDLGIGIKAGQPCTHRITFREKFREESNFPLYRVRESAPVESSRPEVATRWCGNKSEIWRVLCEVSKDPVLRCGPGLAECRSKDSGEDRYHSSDSIRNGRSHVCEMHARSTRYCTDTGSIGKRSFVPGMIFMIWS